MVKNPPAKAGDTGSGLGPGRSHMLRSNEAHAPQLPSLCSRTHETQLLKPVRLEPVLRKRSRRNEKPAAMRSPRTATKSSSRSLQLEKALAQQRRPSAAKNK